MNKKVLFCTILTLVFYSTFLMCLGIFGAGVQDNALIITKYVIKYGLIVIGYVAAICLPFRIAFALKKNKERRATAEHERQLDEAVLRSKKLEAEIAKAYYREEDDI